MYIVKLDGLPRKLKSINAVKTKLRSSFSGSVKLTKGTCWADLEKGVELTVHDGFNYEYRATIIKQDQES